MSAIDRDKIDSRPKQPFEDEIRELALTNATIHGALTYYDLGQWDWTTTMSSLVLALHYNYDTLFKMHVDLVQKSPAPMCIVMKGDHDKK